MKRPKPGFKAYLKTRIRHPFTSRNKLIYVNSAGERLVDDGSVHTAASCALFIMLFITLYVLNYTLMGLITGLLLLLLFRWLIRYLITDFELVDEEGEIIEDKSLWHARERRRKPKWVLKLLDVIGLDSPEDEIVYERYWGWQKALIALEAAVMLAAGIAVVIIALSSPYSRFYSIDTGERSFEELIDRDYGKIDTDYSVNDMPQAYQAMRAYVNGFCPEAQLINYGVEKSENGLKYYLTFKNPMRGVFINKAIETVFVAVSPEGWISLFEFSNDSLLSRFSPVKEPPSDIDTEKILDIILRETGALKDSIGYYYIGKHFDKLDSPDITGSDEDVWTVETDMGEYTVSLKDGTAIKED